MCIVFFCKQKTAYEMRISDWSSDVCSSDLFGDGDGGPGHLHQRQYAFLHPRPARSGEDDIACAPLYGRACARDKGLPHRLSHRSAHEGKVLHAHDNRLMVDLADRVDEGVLLPGGSAGRFHPVAVPFGIPELQRVFADGGRGEADPAIVENLSKARLGADPLVEVALRADRQIFLELAGEQHLSAAPAFVPEIIGRLRSEEHTSELQSLMRISYAVFCLTKKKITITTTTN